MRGTAKPSMDSLYTTQIVVVIRTTSTSSRASTTRGRIVVMVANHPPSQTGHCCSDVMYDSSNDSSIAPQIQNTVWSDQPRARTGNADQDATTHTHTHNKSRQQKHKPKRIMTWTTMRRMLPSLLMLLSGLIVALSSIPTVQAHGYLMSPR